MWLSTHYFSGLLQDWFHVFLYEIKKNSVWYNFYHGTSVSITFYIFEHYQLWMMDSKGQRVFFPKTPQLCVWHTEVRRCYHFKLVSHFQLWFPIWGVLVNRLMFYYFIFWGKKLSKLILLFSKDALNWSKVMIKTFIMLQIIYISDKCCSSELSIHQRNLKKFYIIFNIILNVFLSSKSEY